MKKQQHKKTFVQRQPVRHKNKNKLRGTVQYIEGGGQCSAVKFSVRVGDSLDFLSNWQDKISQEQLIKVSLLIR